MGRTKARKPKTGNERIALIQGHRPEVVDETMAELLAIVDRALTGALIKQEADRLRETIATNAFIQAEILAKNATIRRIRALIFGSSSEKTGQVCPPDPSEPSPEAGAESPAPKGPRKPGHGRRAASKLPASESQQISHPTLVPGDDCPECPKGRLYPLAPRVLVRIAAVSPLYVSRTEVEDLRCNTCGFLVKTPIPTEIGEAKYDASVPSFLGLLRYGTGLPFNRFQSFQAAFGMEMPASTQWDLVLKAYGLLEPAFDQLAELAAQGQLIHQDDTTMKILDRGDLTRKAQGRKAIYTSGLVSQVGEHRIALFLTGNRHAGENLADLLKRRQAALQAPIQMCDALAANTKGDFDTLLAHCLAHARRKFVEVVEDFPEECRHLLEALKEVYTHDSATQGMPPPERLAYHQKHSGPPMQALHTWLLGQIESRQTEPNSGLGKAITYTLRHWEPLTLFLREPGAPLDNNLCERALKRAILHRKNSLFYRTQRGAKVGDLFMSLIHTAELNGIQPFHYLTELQRNHALVEENPEEWLPWNYQQTLDSLPV